jgi:hypothetical protein
MWSADEPTTVATGGEVEIQTETLLRHQVSVDFNIHRALRAPVPEVMAHAPLMLLRKEPGKFLRFDVVDEGGQSLPLSTRARNARVSNAALTAVARHVLGRESPPAALPARVDAELDFIASSERTCRLLSRGTCTSSRSRRLVMRTQHCGHA